ncbi:DUF6297 family protein [Rugosimonospora africana]|uniref:Uncharacterized protein n=1 Tax=Rugosimonospora africana TaxID=556532 RepID=A0A8J3VP11_9ACTN|nr:DUF6297 family protein [Rugosimonospora africana]GIH13482.1 hypothetical protein Raf01_16540 [Rugosimonospora africana]
MSPAIGSTPAVASALPPAPAVPSARRLRRRLRAARREHGSGRGGDIYLVLMIIIVFGAIGPRYLNRYLTHPAEQPAPEATRWWLVVALAVAAAGLTWQALRAFGPLLAMPSTQAWCVASPVARRGWLITPLGYLLLGGALVGAGAGALGTLLAGAAASGAATVGGAAVVGAGTGVAMAGAATGVQTRRWHPAERVPVLVGLAGAVAVIGLRYAHVVPATPAAPVRWSALAVAVVAVAGAVAALGRLGRIDRAALAAGAPLAGAAASAAIFMDATLFSGVVEARRWRRAGRVRSGLRRLRPGPRWAVLLRAEVRRLPRRPGALAIWAALILVPYALVLIAPEAAGAGRVVAGYLAVGRLAAGLRAVCRSPALRRSLGDTDQRLYRVHLVVPAAGALLWWLAGSGVSAPDPNQLVFVIGLVFAVYRNATAPSRAYGGPMVDTPFGLVPVDLLRQVLRGLDVVAVLVFIELFLPA